MFGFCTRSVPALLPLLPLLLVSACASNRPPPVAPNPEQTSLPAPLEWWFADEPGPTEPVASPTDPESLSLQVENLPAAHLLGVVQQELGLSFDYDDCGMLPVSLTAQHMPLTQLMNIVEAQTSSTLSRVGKHLQLRCEQRELRLYSLDYLALNRRMSDFAGLSSSLGSQGDNSSDRSPSGNRSELKLSNEQVHEVWEHLESQVSRLLDPDQTVNYTQNF
ncbi:MAG: hypothetical protein HC848_08500 [Limnobacter sp.]|nr:hypothetical protein [Limnobacter sp.]